MEDKNLPAVRQKTFEELKQVNQYGAEYWNARDLQPLLGYTQWRRFEDAINRAKTSCRQSGNTPEHHFAGAGKMIILGKGGTREVSDYHLSRFACYLIAQNGDPRKPEIARSGLGQRPSLLHGAEDFYRTWSWHKQIISGR